MRRAFTLVEIVIASFILAITVYVMVRVFWTGTRTTVMMVWYSKTQTELRNGLRNLREDLQKASRFTFIKPTDVVRGPEAEFAASVKGLAVPGPAPAETSASFDALANTADTKLLMYYMCRPGKDRRIDASLAADSPGEVVRGEVFVRDRVLRIRRTRLQPPALPALARNDTAATPPDDFPVIYDVDRIRFRATRVEEDISAIGARVALTAKYLLEMEVRTSHPRDRNRPEAQRSKVTETTRARLDVELATLP